MTKTCCRKSDGYLTSGDVHRISQAIRFRDFFEFRVSSDPSYNEQEDDPVWFSSVFRPDGARRVVKHDKQGKCIFLEKWGCRLPVEIRPLVCRLHPHLYNAREIYPFISSDCPINLLQPDERLEEVIQGFDKSRAAYWHRRLYREIIQEEGKHAHRSDL